MAARGGHADICDSLSLVNVETDLVIGEQSPKQSFHSFLIRLK